MKPADRRCGLGLILLVVLTALAIACDRAPLTTAVPINDVHRDDSVIPNPGILLPDHTSEGALTDTVLNPAKPVRLIDGTDLIGGDVQLGVETVLTGGPPGSGEFSYAIYRLPCWWGDELSQVEIDCASPQGPVYAGLSDFERGCWRWAPVTKFPDSETGTIPAGSWATRREPPDGASFLVILAPAATQVVFRGARCRYQLHLPQSASMEDLGPCPVNFISYMNCFVYPPAAPDQRLYMACYDYTGPVFIVEVEPYTGECHTYPVPDESHFVSQCAQTADGKLYFALRESRNWFSFDPGTKQFKPLGQPDVPHWFFSMAASAKGGVWGGSYDGLALVYYDPAAESFTTVCPELDSENYFPRTIAEWHGRVYVGIGPERMGVMQYDPTSAQTPADILPPDMRVPGWVNVFIDDAQRLVLAYQPSGQVKRFFTVDDAAQLTEIETASFGLRLADGTPVAVQGNGQYVRLLYPTGEQRVYFDCDRSSTQVFKLGTGPDGLIYGGTYNCLHLFSLNPHSGVMQDLGNCARVTGQVFSFASDGPLLYIMNYPQGNLTVYNTSKPYALDSAGLAGTAPDANPRSLCLLGDFQHRGLATTVAQDGKVYLGLYADYGSTTGSLSVYDPATEQVVINKPFPGEAVTGLAITNGKLWGTSNSRLFKWDCAKSMVSYALKPVPEAGGTNTRLAADRNGILIGVYDGTPSYLYAFDPIESRVLASLKLEIGKGLSLHHLSLARGPDGLVYGLTLNGPGGNHLYVVDPATFEPHTLWVDPTGYTYDGFAFHGDEVYLARGSHVLRLYLKR